MWKSNNLLLRGHQIKEKSRWKFKAYLKPNENGDTSCTNVLDVAKAVQRGMFTAISAYTKQSIMISDKQPISASPGTGHQGTITSKIRISKE